MTLSTVFFPKQPQDITFSNQIELIKSRHHMLYECSRDMVSANETWSELHFNNEFLTLAHLVAQKVGKGRKDKTIGSEELATLTDLAQMLFRLDGYHNAKGLYDMVLGSLFVSEE